MSDLASEAANVVLLRADSSEGGCEGEGEGDGADESRGALWQVASLVALGQRVVSVVTAGAHGGMGLAGVQMVLAALGAVPPVVNAVAQEVVDLGTIINALRMLQVDADAHCLGLLPPQ